MLGSFRGVSLTTVPQKIICMEDAPPAAARFYNNKIWACGGKNKASSIPWSKDHR
jgi:hypothetical protein